MCHVYFIEKKIVFPIFLICPLIKLYDIYVVIFLEIVWYVILWVVQKYFIECLWLKLTLTTMALRK